MKVKAAKRLAIDTVLAALAERLRAVGYGPTGLREHLGASVPDDIGKLNHAPAWERLRAGRSALAAALRLFYLEADEGAATLRSVLPAAEQRALAQAGLL